MIWNHRVIRKTGDLVEYVYNIHEVYYSVNGEPETWTKNSTYPQGETLAEIEKELKRMLACCNKPVLELVNGKLEEVE